MELRLTLNDAIYNAGIKGLIRVFDDNGLAYEARDNYITFDSSVFDDFTACYLKSLIQLGEDGAFAKLSGEDLENLRRMMREQDIQTEALDKVQKLLLTKIKSASYKSAYVIIKNRGEAFDFEGEAAAIKNCKEASARCGKMIALIEKMSAYRDVFIIKDVVYTKVNCFWTNVAFLNRNENKTEFSESYENSFVKPIQEYIQALESGKKVSKALECCQCNLPITKSQGCSMSWINNQGVDIARKTSPFWNFNVDLMLCPVCNLVYSCVPLGFVTKGSESYFVNSNSSVSKLVKKGAEELPQEEEAVSNYYNMLREFINLENGVIAKQEQDNIQVLRRSGDQMYFNILSKDKLQKMLACAKELKDIVKIRVKLGENYYSLFDETIECILNNKSLHPLLLNCCRQGLRDNRSLDIFKNLCFIEARINNTGGMMEMNQCREITDAGYADGYALKRIMMAGDRNTKKIESLSFGLMNALQTGAVHNFIQLLTRQYMSLGQTMPKRLIECIKDEDVFLKYGDAFVIGLNGYMSEGKSKEETENE